jgi:uncharacterized membrane protein
MNDSSLDKPVDIKTLRRLHQDGFLTDEAFNAALRTLRPAAVWFAWAERNLLFFGSALVLSGIIFFFAYNWSAMGKFFKLGLIEAGVAACVASAYWLGLNKLTGKMLLLSGSVLLGVLMAVYGQTYQTGADAFELFVGWAALIFGWVVVSEFAALWLIWLILVNTGCILYWVQVLEPAHSFKFEYLCLFIAALNGTALALREVAIKKGFSFLEGRWLRGILMLALLSALSIPPMSVIFEIHAYSHSFVFTAASVLVWPVVAGGGYFCYRTILRDMVALALILMNACLILLTLIGKLMLDGHHGSDEFMFLLFALIIIGVVSVTAFWLKRTAAKMAKEIAP